MDALSMHAEHIATALLDRLQEQFGVHPMISVEAWQGVAREIHDKLKTHFAR